MICSSACTARCERVADCRPSRVPACICSIGVILDGLNKQKQQERTSAWCVPKVHQCSCALWQLWTAGTADGRPIGRDGSRKTSTRGARLEEEADDVQEKKEEERRRRWRTNAPLLSSVHRARGSPPHTASPHAPLQHRRRCLMPSASCCCWRGFLVSVFLSACGA
jgi:hypothetical protein